MIKIWFEIKLFIDHFFLHYRLQQYLDVSDNFILYRTVQFANELEWKLGIQSKLLPETNFLFVSSSGLNSLIYLCQFSNCLYQMRNFKAYQMIVLYDRDIGKKIFTQGKSGYRYERQPNMLLIGALVCDALKDQLKEFWRSCMVR